MKSDYSFYPLTYPQKNIYQTEVTYPGTSIGTISATLRIKEKNIDPNQLNEALNLIIKTNDGMRCRIKMIDREPRQYFVNYEYEQFDILDFTNKPIDELFEYDKIETQKPFNLIDSKLYYFSIIKISDDECAIFSKVHHIINDAWAIVRVGNLVLDYYEKLKHGEDIDTSDVPSYIDYIKDEMNYLSSERVEVDSKFWDTRLDTFPNNVTLKQRKSRITNIKSRRKTYLLPEKLSKHLRQYCKDTRTSIFAVILSAFSIYLKRTTHQNNMVIGTPVLNRSSRRQKKTLGMFISTVPLFIDLHDDDNFLEFNKKLTREWMSVLKHQRYPFELLLKRARDRYKDLKDLFDVVISYQNASFTENQSSTNHKSRWHFNECQLESLSIHINDREGEGILVLDYDYLDDLFYEKEIDFLHDNFIRVLWHALDNPSREMSKLELISEDEKQKMLHEFNSKTVEYDKTLTLVDLFKAQVKKTPDKTAIISGSEMITYDKLDKMSDVLAAELFDKGIKEEDIVCLMIDKSVDMIVSILSVLKAGGGYLAIECDLPDERKKYILNDSKVKYLITKNCNEPYSKFEGEVIKIEEVDFAQQPKNIEYKLNAKNIAYIMYTSGTTGQPKGVVIEHKSVVNYVHAFLDEFKYDGSEKVLQQSSYLFDAFVEEVYPTLSAGATLVLSNKYGAKDMVGLAETIKEHEVSVISVSPLVLNELNKINDFSSVKTFISGGDVLKHEYFCNLIENADVYNTYGPTETTVCATYHKCEKEKKENIPIGKPIANYKIYILDSNLNLVPIGTCGELYISGVGLAREYINKPDITDDVFIDNPFEEGERLYRTKDAARWYPMGEIEYMGRTDRQVKIRGVRIELGEIESEMLKIEGIGTAVVIDRIISDDKKKLCAFYQKSGDISVSQVRDRLRKVLPSYMIPSYFLDMEKMPLTPGGKVNTELLPPVERMILSEENEYVAPANETERNLTGIIESLLKVERVGMNDNYFELGGDSLDLTTLAFQIADEFNVDIPLEKLFMSVNIKEIAEYVIAAAPKDEKTQYADNVFLLHKGNHDNNIFFIHDGIGGIGAYVEVGNMLKSYNVWGIRSDIPQALEPQILSIEDMGKRYTKEIIKVADEPYNIAGWCIGGTIAYEVHRQLQLMGKRTGSLTLIDTIGPKKWYGETELSLAEEKEFVSNNLGYDIKSELIKSSSSIKELWENVVCDIEKSQNKKNIIRDFIYKVPDDIVNYLDDYHESPVKDIFTFINVVRSFHIARVMYFPQSKIEGDVCFIQAKENSIESDSSIWDEYVKGEVVNTTVRGDHYTILKSEGAFEISRILVNQAEIKEGINAKL